MSAVTKAERLESTERKDLTNFRLSKSIIKQLVDVIEQNSRLLTERSV